MQSSFMNNLHYLHSLRNVNANCPGGDTPTVLHVPPAPELRVFVKLDGAGVVAQEPQPPLPCHGEGVGGVEHRVWTQSPHCDVAHCHVQLAYRAKGEHASLTDTMQIIYS